VLNSIVITLFIAFALHWVLQILSCWEALLCDELLHSFLKFFLLMFILCIFIFCFFFVFCVLWNLCFFGVISSVWFYFIFVLWLTFLKNLCYDLLLLSFKVDKFSYFFYFTSMNEIQKKNVVYDGVYVAFPNCQPCFFFSITIYKFWNPRLHLKEKWIQKKERKTFWTLKHSVLLLFFIVSLFEDGG
jgi:hypothetical protein